MQKKISKLLTVGFILFIIVCHTDAANIFRILDANNGLTDNQVQHILQIPDGRLIVTTLGNINIYDGARFNYIHKKENDFFELPKYQGAYHVYIGKKDLLWVKTYRSLACFDLKHKRYIEDIDKLLKKMDITGKVEDIFLDSFRDLWVVTPKGLQRSGYKTYYNLPANAGNLQDLEVMGSNLYLFFGTGEVIGYKLSSGEELFRRIAYPSSKSGLYKNTSLVVKGPNRTFYQLRTGIRSLFLAFNTKTNQWHTIMDTPYTLHTLVLTKDNQAYITCPKGYWLFNMRSGKGHLFTVLHTTNGESISNAGLNSVFCDSQGGLWIGTYNRGLLYTHPSSYRFSSTYTGGGNSTQDDSHVTYHEKRYNMIVSDRRGWIWGATNDGLKLMSKKNTTTRSFYTNDGLVNNFVHSIIEDRKGNMWVGTSCGISKIEINKKDKSFTFTNFNREDGTLNGEYMNGKAKLLQDGRILMRGINGYTVFHPDSVKQQDVNLTPILSNILLFGKPLSINKKYDGNVLIKTSAPYVSQLNLNYQQNSLSFEFSALNYINPKQTVYKYRLIGADDKWQITEPGGNSGLMDDKGLLHLSFVNIASGRYTLQVMASNNIHQWRGMKCSVMFTIKAPWWQTSLAFLIYFLITITLITLVIVAYLHIMKRRIQQKQKEESLLQRIQDLIRQVEYEHTNISESNSTENSDPTDDKFSAEQNTAAIKREDAEFVRKATQLVEAHINEQGYSVSELSRDLFMERTGLYKKLTSLIDESPTLFIRHIRLQKAAELISEGKLSIGDIAFLTGFSSSSYLSKCFQDEFGCKPSEYRDNSGTTI
jgi:AraC-like DNA-binding protein/sugar lactone lactonase YvrE